jgi:glycosyltransferase involved in cell wall biosynthesis
LVKGPERGNLVSLTSSLGLESQVFFEGWKAKDELKRFYRSAHFLILPSTGEGWPKVISEAMSFGVVPIVSDVSGIRQNLERIGTGSIVGNFDPVFYAEAVKRYLQEP